MLNQLQGVFSSFHDHDDEQNWHATHECYARSAWAMWKAEGVGAVV